MGSVYVPITRFEFESFLGLNSKRWVRDERTAGIYRIPLSKNVAIHISSSIGTKDDVLGRGRAAIHMKLISTATGHTLNKKALGQSRFNRVEGWERNLKKGLEKFKQAYLKAAGFYDAIAVIKDRDEYKRETLAAIEANPGWSDSRFLKDMHSRVDRGGVLTEKQLEAIKRGPSKSSPSRGKAPEVDEAYLERLRNLWRYARRVNDSKLMKFVEDAGKALKAGRTLTPGQQRWLDKELASLEGRRSASIHGTGNAMSNTLMDRLVKVASSFPAGSIERAKVLSLVKSHSSGGGSDRLAAGKKWIQEAIKDPGRVHRYLGVPEDEEIPKGKLDAAIEKLKKKEDKTDEDKSLMSALLLAKRFKGGIGKKKASDLFVILASSMSSGRERAELLKMVSALSDRPPF